MEDKIIQKKRKISSESFKTKIKKNKDNYKLKRVKIKNKYDSDIEKIQDNQVEFISKANQEKANKKEKQEIAVLKNKKKRALIKEKNKYALRYNALMNQELYHKSVLEGKISEEKDKYRKRKNTNKTFDKVIEKEKLAKKIANLKMRYTKPVSSKLIRNRNVALTVDLEYIKVPTKTPLKKYLRSIGFLLLAAFITTLALDIFIKPFGIYNAGLRGITQMFYYVIRSKNSDAPTYLSYVLFFGANIPLAVFGYIKVGKKFTIYTLIFIGLQLLISLLLSKTGVEDLIMPFGRNASEIFNEVKGNPDKTSFIAYALPFISAFMGAILYGAGVGMVYRAGGSTGGSKFVVTWIAAKKNKSIGFIAMMFSIFVITLGILVNKVIMDEKKVVSAYTSATLFASIIFVYMSNWALDKVFAKSKKIEIDLYTTKKIEIIKFLDLHYLYNRSFSVEKVEGGIEGKNRHKFEFIVSAQESKILVNIFRKIDKSAFISIKPIKKVIGKFYNNWFE